MQRAAKDPSPGACCCCCAHSACCSVGRQTCCSRSSERAAGSLHGTRTLFVEGEQSTGLQLAQLNADPSLHSCLTASERPAHRYAGYPLLLQAIALPEDGGQGPAGAQHFLSAEAAPQLQVCVHASVLHVVLQLERAAGGLVGRSGLLCAALLSVPVISVCHDCKCSDCFVSHHVRRRPPSCAGSPAPAAG